MGVGEERMLICLIEGKEEKKKVNMEEEIMGKDEVYNSLPAFLIEEKEEVVRKVSAGNGRRRK